MNLLDPEDIEIIVIHCTASDLLEDGTIGAIRELHVTPKTGRAMWKNKPVKGRGFEAVGYHKIITPAGKTIDGRPVKYQGAHCFGQNQRSLSICLVGEKHFSLAQFRELFRVLDLWKAKYKLTDSNIYGHYAFSSKPCPNFIVNL